MSPEKRAMDIAIAVFAYNALRPFAYKAGRAIEAIDGESSVFEQQRIGQFGELFWMPKVRTMPVGTEQGSSNGHTDVRRLGNTGKLISTLRIDEVPQLRLVKDGTMSFFAPRALLVVEREQIMDVSSPAEQKEFIRALLVTKPGMVDPHCLNVHTGGTEDKATTRREAFIRHANESSLIGDMQVAGSVPAAFLRLGAQALQFRNRSTVNA